MGLRKRGKILASFLHLVGFLFAAVGDAAAALLPIHQSSWSPRTPRRPSNCNTGSRGSLVALCRNQPSVMGKCGRQQGGALLMSKSLQEQDEGEILGPLAGAANRRGGGGGGGEEEEAEERPTKAATGTVNERLMRELEEAADRERYGARSSVGERMGLSAFRSSKSDEERRAAIEEARNLNGVNPAVALAGGVFALAVAAGLWTATSALGEYFAFHPVESDTYFVDRVQRVVRNVIMGLFSLASGFFGVTGVGIFALGVRVAVGVMRGELDPAPLKKKSAEEEIEMPNVWDLMMNKKSGRGRR